LPNLDFNRGFILDANAFYSGFPFGLSSSKCYTTNSVFNEVKHIKRSYSALEALIDAGNLIVMDAEQQYIEKVIFAAKETGDYLRLSQADLSVLALAFQLQIILVSDDFAVENIATLLKIPFKTIGTKGIVAVRKWIPFCSTCSKAYNPSTNECLICGNKLKRRFKTIH
jgi:endoribonuclease Nob1